MRSRNLGSVFSKLRLRSSAVGLTLKVFIVLPTIAVFCSGLPAQATNGYFSHGYGIKYKSLAGAGAALALGPIATATNPGAMAFVGTGYDISLSIFNPNRQYTVTGQPTEKTDSEKACPLDLFGLAPGTVSSDSQVFFIPSLAGNWTLNEDETMFLGVAVFGNGGMNTNYPTATFDPKGMFDDTSPTGVDLSQLFLAPTFSFTLAEIHGLGISPILAWQRFEANGLAGFGKMGLSSDPAKLTNNKHDSGFGAGLRVGYLGELLDFASFGASYQTRIDMAELSDYAGLFAEQGDFDIPANWTAGFMMGFTGMGMAFDVQQVLYSDIASVANPLLPNLDESRLGDAKGPGFAWRDVTTYKIGAWYMNNAGWMFRAGYSQADQPIPSSDVLFNILAPGIIEKHLTLGISKPVSDEKELNISISRAFSNTVSGPNPLEMPGQQTIELKMDQWEFGVGLSW